jgi:endonuclease/exonuclease/phosphatase (EEP) superfamily protein YafD
VQEHLDSELAFDAVLDRSERATRWPAWLSWLAVLPLALVASLRLIAHDATPELLALNALTQWLYLPAWPALGVALWLRRPRLALCAGLLVAAHIVWLGPSNLLPASSVARGRGRPLRVMSANVYAFNRHAADIVAEIRAARPDVLLVQELSPRGQALLDTQPLRALLPQRKTLVRDDAFGIGIYARVPFAAELLELDGPPALRADLDLGGVQLRIYNVHTIPPVTPAGARRWARMMERLLGWTRQEQGALLVAGDLNATPHTRGYQRLLSDRLRGAHEDRRRGLATTWPNGRSLVPSIRLDHLLVSPQVAVLDVREGIGRGSDHRPLIADLEVLPTMLEARTAH